MSTKKLLIRILDAHKLAQFAAVLSTIASVKEDCNCYLLVTRTQLKFKVAKSEANLCELLAQFKSIFFEDYKYITGDYAGHGFLLNGVEQIAETLEMMRRTVS